jgi:hypothetical protein
MVAVAHRSGLEPGRVEPGIRLGHGKTGFFVAGDQRRQKPPLLLAAAEDDDRVQPEDVHVYRRGAAEPAAGFGDCLHQHGGLGNAEPAAAVSLGHCDAEPAACGHRPVKLLREAARLIFLLSDGPPHIPQYRGVDFELLPRQHQARLPSLFYRILPPNFANALFAFRLAVGARTRRARVFTLLFV